jgi:hypothetical protein
VPSMISLTKIVSSTQVPLSYKNSSFSLPLLKYLRKMCRRVLSFFKLSSFKTFHNMDLLKYQSSRFESFLKMEAY